MKHYGQPIAYNNGLTVIVCKACGYNHLEKLPTQAELDAYYRLDEFYTQHSGGNAWFKKNQDEHEKGYWWPQYQYQGSLLEGRVLDYGCGDGYFLKYYGKSSHGVEPSSLARTYCYGQNDFVYRVFPSTAALKPDTYDSLRLALVAEHILRPRDLIYGLREFMHKPHKIQIIVPNEFSPLQNRVRARYGKDWFVQTPHLNYFDKQQAIDLVKRCGYTVTDTSGTFPMELFYLMGFKYIGNDAIGARVHRMRLSFEKRLGVKAYELYHLLYNKLNWGRESIITGILNG